MEDIHVAKLQKPRLVTVRHAKRIVSFRIGRNGLLAPRIAMEALINE
jgi:hypothetical protein